MKAFDLLELKKLYIPKLNSVGEQNGQITVIGGSDLFHGAPLLALKVASRFAGMVFFSSPEPSFGKIAENIKSQLFSFIWVPWTEVEEYVKKSDAILIGPGMKRFTSELQDTDDGTEMSNDGNGKITKEITKNLLSKFPNKKWVIDAGSLQVMDVAWIPKGAILTPNEKEFKSLFHEDSTSENVQAKAKKYECVVVAKGNKTIVASSEETYLIAGGNPGLNKGGIGDVLAGLTVAILAKNDPFLAACAASYVSKKASDEIYEKSGSVYNADDLSEQIPQTFHNLVN